jgi:hypothetical protein
VAAKDPPHRGVGYDEATPLLAGELSGHSPGAESGVGDREREDSLLDHPRQLVGHLRAPALAGAEDLGPVALDLPLPGVVGRAMDPEGPTGLRHRGPAGEVEELQAVAEQPVIIGHAAHFLSPLLGGEGGRVCRAADASQPAGWEALVL